MGALSLDLDWWVAPTASSPEGCSGRGDGAERRRWRIQRGGGSPKQGVSQANSEVRRLCFGLVAAGSSGIFLGFALVQSATRTTRRKTEVLNPVIALRPPHPSFRLRRKSTFPSRGRLFGRSRTPAPTTLHRGRIEAVGGGAYDAPLRPHDAAGASPRPTAPTEVG